MKRALPLSVLLLAAAAARAEPDVIQIGDHARFGRLVFKLSGSVRATLVQRDDQLDITVPGETIGTPVRVPRNVVSFSGGMGRATVTVAAGARVKSAQTDHLLVVDVLDPTTRAANRGSHSNPLWAASPPTIPAAAAPLPPAPSVPVAAPQASPEPPKAPVPSAPSQESQSADAASPPPSAVSKPAPRDPIHISAAPEVGAVAFRRGDLGIVVFDDRVDFVSDVDNELPDRVTAQQMQGATMLTFPLAKDEAIAMSRDRDGWVVNVGAPTGTVASQTAVPEGIAFQFGQSGRALTISDPVTGQTLLLGTLRQAGRDHSMVETRRSATGYVLLPTWLGLALEVTSDSVDLKISHSGFTLQIPDRSAPGTAVAAVPENQFRIPTAAQDVLMRELDAQIASAATSPPRRRGQERVRAARLMLALGMAPEAQALLTLAANDDPTIAEDPATAALQGIAAVLAQRPADATGLDNPNLPANGDVALWRSLRDVEQGKTSLTLGNFWPTLSRYPATVRQRVGPTVIEAAINAGNTVPATELEGSAFAFARALQNEKAGDIDGALAAFDAIAAQRDERDSVRAAVAATELRLSQGKITPQIAADEIERQTVRWRGNERELAMRLRVAELRAVASQWRPALENLRETEKLFPETKQRIAALKSGVFTLMLFAKNEALKPLDVVTVAGDFADCIPEGKDGQLMAGLLAEKLVALDLPNRAIPVLQHLLDSTPSPVAKAEFALRLARLQLDADDPSKAESLLSSMDPAMLPQPEAEQRLLLLARAKAAHGDPTGAATLLADLDTPASNELRATFLQKSGDWPATLGALQKVAAALVPDTGALTEQQQDIVMREATAAVQANDNKAVSDLKRYAGRIMPPRADVFRLLTANAIQSPDDLPRAARELAMSRALPEQLNALRLR